MSDSLLEPDFQEPYDQWKANPGPAGNAAFLKTLDPVIDKAIRTHVGQSNPLVKSRARRMALDSLPNYNPNRARLQSHIYTQLQGLKRYNAQQGQGVKIPERISLDKMRVNSATQELMDELGRDPSDTEIAEATGLSEKRLAHIRGFNPAMSQGFFAGVGEAGSGGLNPAVQQGTSEAWLDMIYDELDPIDQQILEHSLGLHGKPVMSNNALAAKLSRSPGSISQRKLRIQTLLDQEDEISPFS